MALCTCLNHDDERKTCAHVEMKQKACKCREDDNSVESESILVRKCTHVEMMMPKVKVKVCKCRDDNRSLESESVLVRKCAYVKMVMSKVKVKVCKCRDDDSSLESESMWR